MVFSRLRLVTIPMVSLALLAGCGSRSGDPHSADGVVPPPSGRDPRIRDIGDPSLASHPKTKDTVRVSGAVVTAVDTFDETADGKSRGTIYVQDVDVPSLDDIEDRAYAGISLFSPTFDPPNLQVGPGDTLMLAGQYQENGQIGTAIFPQGTVLPQIARPTAKLQYEVAEPEPTDISIDELRNFETGRKWLGMLVRVHDVELYKDLSKDSIDPKGRLAIPLAPATAGDAGPGAINPPTLVNELADLSSLDIPQGKKLASVTGIVSFFFNLHIAPRSVADIQP